MKLKPVYWIFLIAFLGAALYAQTYNYGYTGDDGIYAYFNRVTQKGLDEWTELFRYGSMNFIQINPVNTSIYRPFTLLTFAVEYAVFGEFDAANGHVANVLLYFLVLLVLGFLLHKIIAKRHLPAYIALLILVLYAVHPIHTEVVASVKSRDTLLASLFGFSAVLLWFTKAEKLRLPYGIGVGLLFFMSLISKEETITFIAVVFLLSYFILRRSWIDSLKHLVPFVVPAVIYMVFRSVVLDDAATTYNSIINSILYQAEGGERLATNLYIYLEYVKLLVFPHPLSWDYSFSQLKIQTFANPVVWLSLLLFGSLIYFAVKGFKNRSLFSFGILFYFATFSIFANLTDALIIGSNLGERFQFIPSLAFCLVVVYGLYRLLLWMKVEKVGPVMLLVLVPVLLAFSWKTIARSKAWKDSLTLAKSGVQTAPNSWRTHMMYAEELRLKGKSIEKTAPDSAFDYFEESVREYDRMFGILGKDTLVPQYLNTLAEVLIGMKDTARAYDVLQRSVRRNPNKHYGWFKYASLSYDQGKYNKAEELYLRSLKTDDPNLAATYINLGLTYIQSDQYQKGIAAFEKSLEQEDKEEVRKYLAYLYTKVGDKENAAKYAEGVDIAEVAFQMDMKAGNDAFKKNNYAEAVENYKSVEPNYPDYGSAEKYPTYFAAYGKSLLELKDTLGAKAKFLQSYDIEASNAVVMTNLGTIAFYKDKNYPLAEQYFKEAIAAGPDDFFSAYTNLGASLIVQRKESEAITAYENALQYGSNRGVLSNLMLLNRAVGNEERMKYYQNLLSEN
ncbi:tetratricopeptide repeat protein [Algoriphagus halophytocola]|uniref:Tetratricopeptide repeat protein n=1 Tax=Algoriphagus halophytocola TaxID=2991499 RepID=A0ABY6MPA5_9BACT|nr:MULTISPECIES: tetratricopeptide repeat protein [unclassified Algoriphagus]UZD24161.1 tetratricopeptide repeat protein [Algoriphagus sp. TR-M5]WBL41532.1 tetratricopeptide repeat protein [Algoriphagus sp. TR-M9]